MADFKNSANAAARIPKMGGGRGGGPMQRFMPTEKPKNASGTVWRLLKIYTTQWKALIALIVLTVLTAGVVLVTPYLIGQAVNAFDITNNLVNESILWTVLIALTAAYLANWALNSVTGWMMAGVSQRLVKYMRRKLFAKLQKLPLEFYDTTPHGDTMSRLTNDIDNISNTIAMTTTDLSLSILNLAGSLVMMLVLSPTLTLVAMITIPLVLLLTRIIAARSRRYFLGQQRSLGELGGIIEESVTGLKMVKAFGREEDVRADFEGANRALCDYSIKAQIWAGLLMPLMNVINNISFACVACVGGVLSVQGSITVGVIVSFITYSRQFGQPLNNIANMFNSIQAALAGAERVFEVMDKTEEPPDSPDAIEIAKVRGSVEFKDVSFSYDARKPVLEHVSFSVRAGEVVALVGETGAGKTTIVNLLTRFYDLNSGEILIDGVNIFAMKREELRRYFSVVLQDTSLFTGTIAENIRYGNPEATDEEVRQAAKMGSADHFISRLPRGYETMVSGNTDNLSMGQRQLLSISRAFLCDAPILILDEATSSVDTRTEKNIQRAMLKLMKGRTSFLIAHRLSTIRDADRIMVVGQQRILESGTHDRLMAQKGVYYRMVVSQLGGSITE